jgi:multiple sugar transport system permease protein
MAQATGTIPQKRVDVLAGRWRWSTSKRREAIIAYLFLAPFLIFFLIFVVRSVISGINVSLYDWNVLAPTHKWLGLKNYESLLKDQVWWTSIRNTMVFAFLTVIGTTIVALAAALAVNQPIRGRDFFRIVFYAPGVLSVGVVGIIWRWMMDTQFGVINYGLALLGLPKIGWLSDATLVLPSLSLVTIWWGFGFPMLIFLAGLQGIPEHLYEAAKIDGANSRQIFFGITLPLLRPTILFVTVTQFIAHLQVFGQPYIIPGSIGGPGYASYTVIIYLYQEAVRYLHAGYASAIAIGLAVVMIVLTLLQFAFLGRRADSDT